MPSQFWSAPLNQGVNAGVAGAAYNTSITATDVSPAPQFTFPAGYLQAGMTFRIVAFGTFSNTATPTLILGVSYGGASGGATLAATGATTTTTAATSWPWRLEATCQVRTNGAAGTMWTQGFVDLATSLTAVTRIPIPAAALAAVTIDTTVAKTLTCFATWGTSSVSNTLTCQGFDIVG